MLRYIWYRISLAFENFVVGHTGLFIGLVFVIVGAAQTVIEFYI